MYDLSLYSYLISPTYLVGRDRSLAGNNLVWDGSTEVPPTQAFVEDRMNAFAAALGLSACRNVCPSMLFSWVASLYLDKNSVDKLCHRKPVSINSSSITSRIRLFKGILNLFFFRKTALISIKHFRLWVEIAEDNDIRFL